jgi:protein-L-isoaspartate(D-aspartate) O-methyltransferase
VTVCMTDSQYAIARRRMVTDQLRDRGIADARVLSAMETVPRHLFVPAAQSEHAYNDCPLPIDCAQTISQPYIVARMTELLHLSAKSRVLEIGTGSGYQTAILAELADEVWTVERLPQLARQAEMALRHQQYTNIHFISADGTLGLAEAAPYDAVLVAAAAPHIPPTLRGQLALGGRMVIPITEGVTQELLAVERLEDRYRETAMLRCAFVPLIGKEGYQE